MTQKDIQEINEREYFESVMAEEEEKEFRYQYENYGEDEQDDE